MQESSRNRTQPIRVRTGSESFGCPSSGCGRRVDALRAARSRARGPHWRGRERLVAGVARRIRGVLSDRLHIGPPAREAPPLSSRAPPVARSAQAKATLNLPEKGTSVNSFVSKTRLSRVPEDPVASGRETADPRPTHETGQAGKPGDLLPPPRPPVRSSVVVERRRPGPRSPRSGRPATPARGLTGDLRGCEAGQKAEARRRAGPPGSVETLDSGSVPIVFASSPGWPSRSGRGRRGRGSACTACHPASASPPEGARR